MFYFSVEHPLRIGERAVRYEHVFQDECHPGIDASHACQC